MLIEKAKEVLGVFKHTQAGTHASSIAFFFFMSIIPMLILYASLVPATGISQQDVTKVLCDMAPAALDDFIRTMVNEAYEKSGLGLSLSILTLLWTASQGARALRGGLNSMFGIEETRGGLLSAVISIGFVLLLFAMLTIVMSLMFNGATDQLMTALFPNAHMRDTMTILLQSVLMLAAGAVMFAACYTFLAAGKRSFRSQLPGAALAAVAWYLFSFGFHIYLNYSNRFAVFYGSLGAVALFLFWMYCICYILLAGAFFNRIRTERAQRQPSEDCD